MASFMSVFLLLLPMFFLSFQHLGSQRTANQNPAQERSFIISNDSFYKDGNPFRILGGELHYFRVVPEYWKDRILRVKAMGLNTVQTYIPWNVHEPSQGAFDFAGSVDLEAFLDLAKALDVLVMLRIGPYVCGEWDFGGFPAWLLSRRPQLRLRTSDSAYLQLVDNWWDVLLPKLVPYLYSEGGPVIMLQIENEYGSYGSDKAYLHHLVTQARKHLGNDAILYTTDGATEEALQGGTITEDNVFAAVDFSTGWDPVDAFALQKKFNIPGKSPSLSAEFYTGWLTHWGEDLARTSARSTAAELDRLLNTSASVVLYMAHGGSNFGFFSGANTGDGEANYQPDITSYDYDAPIGEGGDLGAKYYALRGVFASYIGSPLPDPPPVPARKVIGTVSLQKVAALFEVLGVLSNGVSLDLPVTMEMLNQTSGFILYRSILPSSSRAGCVLTIKKVHDRAQVFIGKDLTSLKFVGTFERWSNISSIQLHGSVTALQLYILVENMGRINYGKFIYDPKGILSSVLLDGTPITGWVVYPLSLNNAWSLQQMSFLQQRIAALKLLKNVRGGYPGPAFYSGAFEIDSPADTFLSFKGGWSKGVAYVNGFNLGRFWPAAGPQCTLYVPAPVLRSGRNELMVLELESTSADTKSLNLIDQHDWTCSIKTSTIDAALTR